MRRLIKDNQKVIGSTLTKSWIKKKPDSTGRMGTFGEEPNGRKNGKGMTLRVYVQETTYGGGKASDEVFRGGGG